MSTLSIGQAARLLGVSTDTLRNWEETGKLVPTRNEFGRRLYTPDQIDEIRQSVSGDTEIQGHCIKVAKLKKAFESACEGFRDSDIVTVTFLKHNGYNGVAIGLNGNSRFTICAVEFEAQEIFRSHAGDDTFDLEEAMRTNFADRNGIGG